jgi:hypothetical protein
MSPIEGDFELRITFLASFSAIKARKALSPKYRLEYRELLGRALPELAFILLRQSLIKHNHHVLQVGYGIRYGFTRCVDAGVGERGDKGLFDRLHQDVNRLAELVRFRLE